MQESEFVKKLMEQLKRQSEEIALLKKQVSMMSRYISVLEEKLQRYEHPKNSNNSSMSPTQDPFRLKRTTSLREKSGKRQAGYTKKFAAALPKVRL
jgi:predicted RNase H-like nuclease (RuvC/YqgF family)